MMNDTTVDFNPLIFVTNAAAAFALNMSVFMLIGRTSALTMNVAGVIKVYLSLQCQLIKVLEVVAERCWRKTGSSTQMGTRIEGHKSTLEMILIAGLALDWPQCAHLPGTGHGNQSWRLFHRFWR